MQEKGKLITDSSHASSRYAAIALTNTAPSSKPTRQHESLQLGAP